MNVYFNPRSRKGSDGGQADGLSFCDIFQSTLPQGERRSGAVLCSANGGISIHAPARGATELGERSPGNGHNFNPRSRKGSDPDTPPPAPNISNFNPRSRKGSDNTLIDGLGLLLLFQSTLPQGERLCSKRLSSIVVVFQSTLPQGERQIRNSKMAEDIKISIHAPARGATVLRLFAGLRIVISIHAPARGATLWYIHIRRCGMDFNPRSRKGSDMAAQTNILQNTVFQSTLPQGERRVPHTKTPFTHAISIHAPARGATFPIFTSLRRTTFQSTLPQGERRGSLSIMQNPANFNPRSRKGSDAVVGGVLGAVGIFQSTLPQGERQTGGGMKVKHTGFQSTLPQGERPDTRSWPERGRLNFNPRSRKGSD